ncbi:MAG: signal peptidase I [Bacteroidetes bacterium]|nr:signal peptidase I [Bacteroidota bacterium]
MKRYRSIWFILLIIAIMFGSFRAYNVPTGSMENTVFAGETMLVEKFSYGISTQNLPPVLCDAVPYKQFITFRLPDHGETVIFRHTGERDDDADSRIQLFMKRCIAVSGDLVELRHGELLVNGQLIPPPRTAAQVQFSEAMRGEFNERNQYATFPVGRLYSPDDWGPMRVPSKGDTLFLSATGYREWASFIRKEGHDVNVDEETIDNIPASWYIVERTYMFALGDNRTNSVDSRYFGFVPTDDVIGTPLIILKAVDPETGSFIWNRVGTIIH